MRGSPCQNTLGWPGDSGERMLLTEAIKRYRAARGAWAELARRAEGVYVADVTFGPERHQRGHWRDRLPAIDQDIARMEKVLDAPAGPDAPRLEADRLRAVQQAVLGPARPRPAIRGEHTPPVSFRPGAEITIELSMAKVAEASRPVAVLLRYRPVNQAEAWSDLEMKQQDAVWRATIPAAHTRSPYPLQYFFELRNGAGARWLSPGLGADWCSQPYHVVRQAANG